MQFYSTAEIADAYRVTRRRINQIASARGITPRRIGSSSMWTEKQVQELKPTGPRRPRGRR
jgi:hypothetical protein